jgi:arsenite methyltransferase
VSTDPTRREPIAGALSTREYRAGPAVAGLTDITVTHTHPVAEGLHSAIIRAVKPSANCSRVAGCRAATAVPAASTTNAAG